jgi:hypothetical protein
MKLEILLLQILDRNKLIAHVQVYSKLARLLHARRSFYDFNVSEHLQAEPPMSAKSIPPTTGDG